MYIFGDVLKMWNVSLFINAFIQYINNIFIKSSGLVSFFENLDVRNSDGKHKEFIVIMWQTAQIFFLHEPHYEKHTKTNILHRRLNISNLVLKQASHTLLRC